MADNKPTTIEEVLCEIAGCYSCSYKKKDENAICPAVVKALKQIKEMVIKKIDNCGNEEFIFRPQLKENLTKLFKE